MARRPHGITPAQVADAEARHRAGTPWKCVAHALGVGESTLRRVRNHVNANANSFRAVATVAGGADPAPQIDPLPLGPGPADAAPDLAP